MPEGEAKDCGLGIIFEEILAENSLNLVKDINKQIQEAQQTPSRINSNKFMTKTSYSKC